MTIFGVCVITALAGSIAARDGSHADIGLLFTAQAAEETVYENVRIHSGDTLWNIASAYTEPTKDIRKHIQEICVLNDIEPGSIYPGQIIKVPVSAHLINYS